MGWRLDCWSCQQMIQGLQLLFRRRILPGTLSILFIAHVSGAFTYHLDYGAFDGRATMIGQSVFPYSTTRHRHVFTSTNDSDGIQRKETRHDLICAMTLFFGEMVDESSGRFYAKCVPATGERFHVRNPIRDLAAAWDASKALLYLSKSSTPHDIKRLTRAIDTTVAAYKQALVPKVTKDDESMLVLDSVQIQEQSHIAHSALLILAGLGSMRLSLDLELSTKQRWIEGLVQGILSMQRPDGAFCIAFGNGMQDDNVYQDIEFYPGEAMVAITEVYAQSLDIPGLVSDHARVCILKAMEKAFDFYSKHYETGTTDVNYNIWQIQAFSRLYHMLEATDEARTSIGAYVETLCWGIVTSRVWKYELARGQSFYPNLGTIEIVCGLDALSEGISVLRSMRSEHVDIVQIRIQNAIDFLLWAEQQLPPGAIRGQGGLGDGGTMILEQRLDVTGHALSATIKVENLQSC